MSCIITSAFVIFSMHLPCKTLNNIIARLMQEITVHTRLATGVSKEAINLDYIKPLRDAIVRPLAVDGTEGVDAAVNVMSHYHLLRLIPRINS